MKKSNLYIFVMAMLMTLLIFSALAENRAHIVEAHAWLQVSPEPPNQNIHIYLPLITNRAATPNTTLPQPPLSPTKLIFIHHSTGEGWLEDNYGDLGKTLMQNNYIVSDTNYGWGSDDIGGRTDIGHWMSWFRGSNTSTYTRELYQYFGRNANYSRVQTDPGGENEIVMFKSCFPNSGLRGSIADPIPAITQNPLKDQGSDSPYHTVSNAKGIYIDLLEYFKTRPDKLFIVITAPPLGSGEWANNARAFNNWLVNDWLRGYQFKNLRVFDFYNVLTSNGGSPDKNDLASANGNHHRFKNGKVEHIIGSSSNTLAYPTGDDHPSKAGDLKASAEFLPLLNLWVAEWKAAQ
ncbi:MAG: hypothetical protein VB108_08760 [Anaerolineaceae bacterium]|nr:hypothetical protein [Anaerolineaceae bacterium]